VEAMEEKIMCFPFREGRKEVVLVERKPPMHVILCLYWQWKYARKIDTAPSEKLPRFPCWRKWMINGSFLEIKPELNLGPIIL
jgi:hypothetical protein